MNKTKTKKALNDWQVLEKMAEQSKDIRAFRHVLGIELKGRKNNEYGEVKIQVDPQTHQDIGEMMLSGSFGHPKKIVVLYVIDREQFDEIKNQ